MNTKNDNKSRARLWVLLFLSLLGGFGLTAQFVSATPFAYVPNAGDNTVSVIAMATNTVTTTIHVGVSPFAVAITPDGSRAYVANAGDNTISVITTVTNSLTTTIPLGVSPFGVAITPDGRRAYVTNINDNSVSVINTATNSVVGSPILVGAIPYSVIITPDGTHV